MGINKYPHLFQPIVLGNRIFRNRIFASPTGYQNINGDGFLNEGAAAYYGRKAMGGVASVATFEGVVDGEFGKGGSGHICLDTPRIEMNLGRVSYGISQYGAVATLELQHCGMFANRDLAMFGGAGKGIAYGPVECEYGGRHIQGMTEEIIERTINKFIDAAVLAKRLGFGMVLIHAGHGWGLHQFLSPITNTRTDKWGGKDIENRCRMLIAIIDGIHKKCGKGFPVEVRISASECYEGGYGIENGIAIACQLEGHADLIHVSAGNHEVDEVFTITHPSMFQKDGCNVYLAEEIKKHVKTPVATIGALSDPELMEEIIATGKADVVELGRELMADPDFVNKIRTGNEDSVKTCMRCLSCFSSELTHGEPYCALNPESGRELEVKYAIPAPNVKKKVLIIGGGCAGMEAAITSVKRGHEVILCEKSSRLGGVLRCEENVDFKKKLEKYLNQQETIIGKMAIDVRLNTEVTPSYAKEVGADVIIAALGAKQLVPNIKGIDNKNVYGAIDAYKKTGELGESVVILGAGLVGVELGLHLRALGKKVTIVEMTDHMNDGGNFLHMSGVRVEVKKRGLEIKFETMAKEITENEVICQHDGNEVKFAADSVIYAVGMVPLTDELMKLYDCANEFYPIGDCVLPSNITNATTTAYMTGMNLGRC
ncbi:2,4-dienoyl-CoA reductase [Acetitomaculum ruminis DSM 5522]|uniref:2,4-dienoyl-CoA reductase n=1 Tax=Acetitomaculum ruminis DSM 5522 TaxID=1120918 RepID=A0A1I0W6W0_9FIRM|nr:NAD(P)/FAD-dependent oxidoreductase [Acetitomaculum ruminis]SFA84311.1 2,4-dienoyl-CoA reductase [Acetitomaculum ruminis DSM 5522]